MRVAKFLLSLLVVLAAPALTTLPTHAQTLAAVKARGALNCGVSDGLYGFSARDDKGAWTGFDVDLCRAIAAAIFNDASKVNFTPFDSPNRFNGLRAGSIDVLSRNTTWTMARETELGVSFAATNYYDGQGFLVRRALTKESALELDGTKVCVQKGTTTELNLGDYFRVNNMKSEVTGFATASEAAQGLQFRAVQRADRGHLAALRVPARAFAAERPCHFAGGDLEGAARPGGAPGRRAVVQHRAVGAICDDQRRGARRDLAERRRRAQIGQAGRQAPGRHRRRLSASGSA